jgi:hypothetical protein
MGPSWLLDFLLCTRRQTPRQDARTPAGREHLEVLLLNFAAHEKIPVVMRPNFVALRREPGSDGASGR